MEKISDELFDSCLEEAIQDLEKQKRNMIINCIKNNLLQKKDLQTRIERLEDKEILRKEINDLLNWSNGICSMNPIRIF